MGAANALGTTSTTTAITIGGNGALDIGGNTLGTRAITAQGAGPAGAANPGALINTGADNQSAISSFTMLNDTTVGGTGRFDFSTSFNGGGFALTKSGTNEIVIKSTGATNLGNVTINSGTLTIQDTSTLTAVGNVTINNTGTLGFWAITTPFVRPIIANDGSAIQGGSTTNTVNSTISIAGTVTLKPSANLVLAGNISGAGTLTKNNSAGTVVLTATGNTWSNGADPRAINIQGGRIDIGNGGANGSIPSSGTINVDTVIDSVPTPPVTYTGILAFNSSNTLNLTSSTPITGSGNVQQNGTGMVVFAGANTYTGSTTIGGYGTVTGILRLQHPDALGTSSSMSSGVNIGGQYSTGQLQLDGAGYGGGFTLSNTNAITLMGRAPDDRIPQFVNYSGNNTISDLSLGANGNAYYVYSNAGYPDRR